MKQLFTTKRMVRAAVIAAMYTLMTIFLGEFAYGPIQFRLGEALTILPLFFPEAIVGLTVGCLLSNIVGTIGFFDIALGVPATLFAAILTFIIGRLIKNDARYWLGILPPIFINALVVPVILLLYGIEGTYWFFFLTVGAGQAAVIIVLGLPLYYAIKRLRARKIDVFI